MTITRPHVCELTLASAEADDHGNVLTTLHTDLGPGIRRALTPSEAREYAAELTAAADAAEAYLAEQKETRP